MQPVLRLTFSGQRVLVPPPIVRVPRSGVGFGRDATNQVRLNDARASRRHATIFPTDSDTLTVVDEGSKNGTFVNGSRIAKSVVAIGDVVSIGDSSLVVGIEPTDAPDERPAELAGDSAAIRRARALVRQLGPATLTVLLQAETGCGKEVVARALHAASGATGAFVAVNCAAIPESLFESQLFGHTARAFNGATPHDGFFRAATNGTLLLDEIGELPLALQPKLLRAIQERSVVPLGASRPVPCPLRIVAATNRNLAADVDRGAFRADLLGRLFEARIDLVPVRERREDILTLFSLGLRPTANRITHALAEALQIDDWPFNVRELLSCARSFELASPAPSDAPSWFRSWVAARRTKTESRTAARRVEAHSVDVSELTRLLRDAGGNVAEVARKIRRSRRQVYRWIEKHGIRVGDFRDRV